LPIILIVWNILGLWFFDKDNFKYKILGKDTGDVRINFLNYCKDYLSSRTDLSDYKIQILVLDLLLDKYAIEYSLREQKIKDYLKSIGHPLGDS